MTTAALLVVRARAQEGVVSLFSDIFPDYSTKLRQELRTIQRKGFLRKRKRMCDPESQKCAESQ